MYARERLVDAGDDRRRGRHADWVLGLAEGSADSTHLDRRHRTCAPVRHPARDRPRDALRLCVELRPFWLRRIDLAEASGSFAAALEADSERTLLRVEAL